jgi:hypothetical protein
MGEMDFTDFGGLAEGVLWGGLTGEVHRGFMRRCLALAERGWGKVSPNPMVGAVLVRDGVVLAEGWHDVFGGAHAERMLFEGLEARVGSGDGLGGELGLRPLLGQTYSRGTPIGNHHSRKRGYPWRLGIPVESILGFQS